MILLLSCLGTFAAAGPQEDANFFLDHFVGKRHLTIHLPSFKKHSPVYYRSAFRDKGVIILDPKRFQEGLPPEAAIDAAAALRSDLSSLIIENYGAENLAAITAFFRTPLGERMLVIAKNEQLFHLTARQTKDKGPIHRWPHYLSRLDRARYQTFADTSAGRFFITQSWTTARSINARLSRLSQFPNLPLNRSYIIDLINTDGIFQFPNRIARANLIRELSAKLP
jgi:hypothetical protein